jgi:hypothetical protein
MRFSKGLTTWCLRVDITALMWRWNMPLREAMRTRAVKKVGSPRLPDRRPAYRGVVITPLVLEAKTEDGDGALSCRYSRFPDAKQT